MQKNISKKLGKKKRILLILLLVLLVTTPIVLYLVLKDKESDEWYSSDWNYRRALYLENSKDMDLSDEDILIELDTKSLIADGKMQGDCDDLRILDSDNSTSLKYWIEGGCNTDSTQIWVRIPSFPSDGKTIYAYYGNEKAPNAEEQWSGSFLMFTDSTECSDEWYKTTDYDGYFLYGASTAGLTGGSNTHAHENISLSSFQEYIKSAECDGDCEQNTYIDTGSESYFLGISNADNIPPYYTLSVCESNDLKYVNQISYFDTSKIPDGWVYFSDADGKFIMADSVAGITGGREEHTHQVVTLSSSEKSSLSYKYTNFLGTIDQTGISSGNFSAVYIESASNIPAYEVLSLAKSSSEEEFGKEDMILSFTELPPLGWEYYSSLENKFPLVGESTGNTGGSNTHIHSVKFLNFSSSEETTSGTSLNISSFDTTLSEESNIPEYTTVIYARRKDSVNVSIEKEETNTQEDTNKGKNSSVTGVEENQSNTNTTNDGNVKGASTAVPTFLQVEGQEEPDSVTDITPEFTAIFNDLDTGDTGVYYRVQIGVWNLFPGTLVWDSGKVSMTSTAIGSRCPEIIYAGSVLSYNGETYYWRIKFWDNDGSETDWSEIYVFRMAGGGKPSNVLIDNESNPSFLVSASPNFTAVCTDPDGDNCSAYQIEVNTSSNFNGIEYWNSGKVSLSITNNARSSNITYKGTPLTNSGTTLYWRLLLWDTNDLSDSTGATGSFADSYPSFDLSGVKLEGIKIN